MQITVDEQNRTDLEPFLDTLLSDLALGAGTDILDTSLLMWRGLAAIIIVWTGLRIAFSGDFRMWDVIRLVIALWIPWTMLTFYDTPLPGTANLTIPQMVVGGGNWIQRLFINDIATDYLLGFTDLSVNLVDAAALVPGSPAGGGALRRLVGALAALPEVALATLRQFVGTILLIAIGLMLIALYAITYAQVIWAQIAIALLVIIGPIFIPFLLIEPLAFLFWGWFKSLLTFSLYGAVAAAIMRVFLGIGLGFIEALSNIAFDLNSLWILVSWTASLVPLLVAGILASLSVGSFASGLVTGSGGGSGIMGMIGQAAAAASTGGAALVARTATKGV